MSMIHADEVNVEVSDESDLPDGWEKNHEEYRKPVTDVSGHYLYGYESEHFLVNQEVDKRDGKTVHYVTLLKVKRDDNGERLTALGTGIYKYISIPEDAPAYVEDKEKHKQAHEEAERAAFQVAVNMMRDVNRGKYEHKKFSED